MLADLGIMPRVCYNLLEKLLTAEQHQSGFEGSHNDINNAAGERGYSEAGFHISASAEDNKRDLTVMNSVSSSISTSATSMSPNSSCTSSSNQVLNSCGSINHSRPIQMNQRTPSPAALHQDVETQACSTAGRNGAARAADITTTPSSNYRTSNGRKNILPLMTSASLECCELYNGQVRDLIRDHVCGSSLSIRVHPDRGVYVDGLSVNSVLSATHCLELLKEATERRTQVPTSINPSSSRSHLICTLKLYDSKATTPATADFSTQHDKFSRGGGSGIGSSSSAPSSSKKNKIPRAVIQFVDLAGREQLGEEHGYCKTLKGERNHINTSLYHLGHYVSGTGISKFRDTKLTMLVSQTLANLNTRRYVIATLSPLDKHRAENLATLRFCKNLSEKVLSLPVNPGTKFADLAHKHLHDHPGSGAEPQGKNFRAASRNRGSVIAQFLQEQSADGRASSQPRSFELPTASSFSKRTSSKKRNRMAGTTAGLLGVSPSSSSLLPKNKPSKNSSCGTLPSNVSGILNVKPLEHSSGFGVFNGGSGARAEEDMEKFGGPRGREAEDHLRHVIDEGPHRHARPEPETSTQLHEDLQLSQSPLVEGCAGAATSASEADEHMEPPGAQSGRHKNYPGKMVKTFSPCAAGPPPLEQRNSTDAGDHTDSDQHSSRLRSACSSTTLSALARKRFAPARGAAGSNTPQHGNHHDDMLNTDEAGEQDCSSMSDRSGPAPAGRNLHNSTSSSHRTASIVPRRLSGQFVQPSSHSGGKKTVNNNNPFLGAVGGGAASSAMYNNRYNYNLASSTSTTKAGARSVSPQSSTLYGCSGESETRTRTGGNYGGANSSTSSHALYHHHHHASTGSFLERISEQPCSSSSRESLHSNKRRGRERTTGDQCGAQRPQEVTESWEAAINSNMGRSTTPSTRQGLNNGHTSHSQSCAALAGPGGGGSAGMGGRAGAAGATSTTLLHHDDNLEPDLLSTSQQQQQQQQQQLFQKSSTSTRKMQDLDRCFHLQIQRLRDAVSEVSATNNEKKLLESQIMFLKSVRKEIGTTTSSRASGRAGGRGRRRSLVSTTAGEHDTSFLSQLSASSPVGAGTVEQQSATASGEIAPGATSTNTPASASLQEQDRPAVVPARRDEVDRLSNSIPTTAAEHNGQRLFSFGPTTAPSRRYSLKKDGVASASAPAKTFPVGAEDTVLEQTDHVDPAQHARLSNTVKHLDQGALPGGPAPATTADHGSNGSRSTSEPNSSVRGPLTKVVPRLQNLEHCRTVYKSSCSGKHARPTSLEPGYHSCMMDEKENDNHMISTTSDVGGRGIRSVPAHLAASSQEGVIGQRGQTTGAPPAEAEVAGSSSQGIMPAAYGQNYQQHSAWTSKQASSRSGTVVSNTSSGATSATTSHVVYNPQNEPDCCNRGRTLGHAPPQYIQTRSESLAARTSATGSVGSRYPNVSVSRRWSRSVSPRRAAAGGGPKATISQLPTSLTPPNLIAQTTLPFRSLSRGTPTFGLTCGSFADLQSVTPSLDSSSRNSGGTNYNNLSGLGLPTPPTPALQGVQQTGAAGAPMLGGAPVVQTAGATAVGSTYPRSFSAVRPERGSARDEDDSSCAKNGARAPAGAGAIPMAQQLQYGSCVGPPAAAPGTATNNSTDSSRLGVASQAGMLQMTASGASSISTPAKEQQHITTPNAHFQMNAQHAAAGGTGTRASPGPLSSTRAGATTQQLPSGGGPVPVSSATQNLLQLHMPPRITAHSCSLWTPPLLGAPSGHGAPALGGTTTSYPAVLQQHQQAQHQFTFQRQQLLHTATPMHNFAYPGVPNMLFSHVSGSGSTCTTAAAGDAGQHAHSATNNNSMTTSNGGPPLGMKQQAGYVNSHQLMSQQAGSSCASTYPVDHEQDKSCQDSSDTTLTRQQGECETSAEVRDNYGTTPSAEREQEPVQQVVHHQQASGSFVVPLGSETHRSERSTTRNGVEQQG
ncbi:unnamed protein product [Amoebophrya sp. A120]|nr:unnamed protein product [Amoebophrya sp. A120]|eukprot:GSA120T00001176001.1